MPHQASHQYLQIFPQTSFCHISSNHSNCETFASHSCLQSSWKNNQFWHWQPKKKLPKRPDSISVWYISDTLAEVDKRWFNHRSPAVISFLPVIPVVQGRPLCSNSLCLTSSDNRILLIHSTWSGLLVPRGINTRSITSNQTLITFSALIAIGLHVTCYCKVCLVSIDSNDQTTEADIFVSEGSVTFTETNYMQGHNPELLVR